MPSKQNEGKPDLIQVTIFFLLTLVLAYLYTKGYAGRPKELLIARDALTLITSAYFSYMVTHYFSARSVRGQLQELAHHAGRRIALLATDLRSLSDEIRAYHSDQELIRYQFNATIGTLERYARAAELSIAEINDIGEIDISVRDIVAEVSSRADYPVAREAVLCPSCGDENIAFVKRAPGSTARLECSQCQEFIDLHRKGDGKVSVVPSTQFRVSCPRPGCEHTITVNKRPSERPHGTRRCFECYSVVTIDMIRSKAIGFAESEPPVVEVEDPSQEGLRCPGCQSDQTKIFRNGKSERILFCRACKEIAVLRKIEGETT